MEKLMEVTRYGQAPWLAYLRRAFIESGELRHLVDSGIKGIITDISVTEKAISCSADYDRLLQRLIRQGKPAGEIYEALLIDDAQRAADYLHPVFEESEGVDGYVTIPLDPALAHDAVRLVANARHLGGLCGRLDRPNNMIEIPATPAGIEALRQLIADGCNVCVSHIFSVQVYRQVAMAYLEGLEAFLESHSVWRQTPASVAGFSLAPLDNAVDRALAQIDRPDLQGKTAIALARTAYKEFQEIFSGERWERLAHQEARPQRLLWRDSTPSNFAYPRAWYVNALIGQDTVHALSLATLNAFQQEGELKSALANGQQEARSHLALVAGSGINLDEIAWQLQAEKIMADAQNYQRLVQSVPQKRDELEASWQRISVEAGSLDQALSKNLATICDERLMCRIWLEEEEVWPGATKPPLGWLHLPGIMEANTGRLERLRQELLQAGYEKVVVLGTGRATRASALFADTFSNIPALPGIVRYAPASHLPLEIVTLENEDYVAEVAADPALPRFLFLLMDEPGKSSRLRAAFYSIYEALANQIGKATIGNHFVAVTQRGSPIAELAREENYRALFLDDPHCAGDFATLGYAGLVPATLAGADVRTLVERAGRMACNASGCNCPLEGDNIAGQVGTFLGTMANQGRRRATLIASPALLPLATWVAQLLASSSQRQLRPLVHEVVAMPEAYAPEHLFVYLRLDGDETQDEAVQELVAEGHPLIEIRLKDLHDLGGQLFFWQMAMAVAAYHLQVNPFEAVSEQAMVPAT